jgi:hypothetical protein
METMRDHPAYDFFVFTVAQESDALRGMRRQLPLRALLEHIRNASRRADEERRRLRAAAHARLAT